MRPPHRIRTKNDFEKIRIEVLKPLNGWLAYQITDCLKYILKWNKKQIQAAKKEDKKEKKRHRKYC